MLFFGRMSPYKGIEMLYEAMVLAADRLDGIRLIVAGPNGGAYRPPDPPVLGNGCTIDSRIGYVSNPELAALFQKAAVVVCPYLDATQSGVVLTAHGFDRPVIASAVGGLPEYVDHGQTGILIPPRDPRALANAIVEILGDYGRWRMMREAIGQRRHADRSWDQAAERLLNVYQKSVTGRG
jgi:glycosyltransferase involved in cell wall biosynthesis